MKTKICNTCNEEKPLNEFYTHNQSKDGYTAKCIKCTKERRNNLKHSFSDIPQTIYVYIIINKAWPDYIKIGRAVDPNHRLISYQTSSPLRDYEIIYTKKINKLLMCKIESYFYDTYGNDYGEWYELSTEEVINIIEEIILGQ